jgi:hypothetical protein
MTHRAAPPSSTGSEKVAIEELERLGLLIDGPKIPQVPSIPHLPLQEQAPLQFTVRLTSNADGT